MVSLQKMSSFIVSSLSGIDVIKGYNLSEWNTNEFKRHNDELLDYSVKISFFRSFLMPILQNLENILKVVILSVGGYYVITQGFTIGELTAFISYSALLAMPIMGLGWLTTIIETGMVGIASIETVLRQEISESEIPPLAPQQTKALFDNGIEIRNLTYTYPGQDKPELRDISFSILPDQTIGIFGKIGSGKTTLVNCLNRYLPVPRGSILINGHDIRDLSPTDVRSVIRTVSQDVFLFSDSVKNNILFGAPDDTVVSPDTLNHVLQQTALSDEIERFPHKLTTMIGEKGIMLSGGQKQRISLARSMMTSTDLLILDNVLSAVDYETERFLLSQILKRKASKSLLIVSHRIQALEQADTILVLEDGIITDRGTHQELIGRPGLYYDTWKLQEHTPEEEHVAAKA